MSSLAMLESQRQGGEEEEEEEEDDDIDDIDDDSAAPSVADRPGYYGTVGVCVCV